ncbi:MAG: hypothetical protein ACPLW7_02545 [Minisyncoccia bacterium]
MVFMSFFTTFAYADDGLITIKTNIEDVKTNNKYFVISGTGQKDTVLELILNDNINDKWVIGDNGLFAKLLTLTTGDNYIVLKATKGDQQQILKGHVIFTKRDGVLQITISFVEDLFKSLINNR